MGLLDFANTPEGMQGLSLLAAAAPTMEPTNLAGRIAMAGNTYRGLLDNQLRSKYINAQIGNLDSEVAQRKAATEKLSQGLGLLSSVLNGSGQPSYAPGQLGSGTFGVLPNSDPYAPANQGPRGLAGATPEQIAAIKAYTGTDLMEPWKIAKEGFEVKPGSYRVDASTGRREYVPNPVDGRTVDASGRVGLMPGYTDATVANTLATEAPKALLSAAGTINLRKNGNGTESPVSALDENTTLQNVLSSLLGGRGNVGAPTPAAPAGSPGRPVINPADQKAADAESIRMIQSELQNPSIPADQRAGMERELQRLQASQGQAGFPTPTLTRPAYGKTTQQQIAEDADKETALQRAKDIAEQRKSIMTAAFSAPTNIARYQQIGKLLENVDGGALTAQGTHLASLANSLGLKIDKNLPNKEAASALANEAALKLRDPSGGAGMPGAMSDSDRGFLQSMTPNMAQSAQGRQQIISSYIAVQQRNQQVADFARKYEQKYGKLDNGFFDQLQAWSNANPLFKGQ